MSPSSSIAHYRITSKLGEGGMGAVYRAIDTKLNREVAIKVLPDSFANDPDRLARFTREAQVLAALNHPNIAAVYGVEDRAIVMELVEGQDLRGPLPIGTAVDYARQMALGLEAAHEKGIIHRDLKPANIKVTPDGVVKLLDFGLAKSTEPASGPNLSISPTMTIAGSVAGMILGTAAYMAPEQARGKTVDKRADIWAFGVVFYEMLTGTALFGAGETVTDILAAAVTREPDWTALPDNTPPHIRRLLERCLRKDPKLRLRDIGEARIALEETSSETGAPAVEAPARRALLPWAIAAAAVLLAGGQFVWQSWRSAPQGIASARFAIPFPEDADEIPTPGGRTFVPSPDGQKIAFAAMDKRDHQQRLWIRPINSTVAQKIEKSDGANFPFWSPDSQSVGFFADSGLRRLDVATGAIQTICEFPGTLMSRSNNGATWGPGGVILFGAGANQALSLVAASGGTPEPATQLDLAAKEHRHGWPQFLPDGKRFLYLAQSDDASKEGIYAGELGSRKRTLILRTSTPAVFVAPNFLMFVREQTLMAQRFDADSLRLSGEAIPLATDVTASPNNGRAAFAVSDNGVLVYRYSQRGSSAASQTQLNWVDRSGKVLGPAGKPGPYSNVRPSPDGHYAAVIVRTDTTSTGYLGLIDLANGTVRSLTTVNTNRLFWAFDSQHLYCSRLSGGVFAVAVDSGAISEITSSQPLASVDEITPDGNSLIVRTVGEQQMFLLSLTGDRKLQPLGQAPQSYSSLRLSPDGKRVAWSTAEVGRTEVMVAEFPTFAGRRQVSTEGGGRPVWGVDGRELFYIAAERLEATAVMSVEIPAGTPVRPGAPKELFSFQSASNTSSVFAPAADGKRFLVLERNGPAEAKQIEVVLNWRAEFHL